MAVIAPQSPDTTKETAAAVDAKADAIVAEATDAQQPAQEAASAAKAPTYLSTKRSKAYTLSKQLLAAGSLDDALSMLEAVLKLSRESLAAAETGDDQERSGGPGLELHESLARLELNERHESLAPLYYLYGTTLLYSVEEGDTIAAGGKNGDTVLDVSQGEQNDGDDGPLEEGEEGVPAAADPAEDLQVAWENLDLARTIVSGIVAGFGGRGDGVKKSDDTEEGSAVYYTKDERSELLLDLAQIHTRLGDLRRANDNSWRSISDYDTALELRVQCLGQFDRRVADSHFSLAGAYAAASNGAVRDSLGCVDDDDQYEPSDEERVEFRTKSLGHYLSCGTVFAGLLAGMCEEDAKEFTCVDIDGGMVANGRHCEVMRSLRCRVSELATPAAPTRPIAYCDEFNDLKEMMDEIQELMDAAGE